MAVRGRPFQKGTSGNPGGRPRVLGDVQDLARQQSPEAINTLATIMQNEKAPPAARVAAANALLDRGYGKPTQPISQTLAKIDPSTMSDEELAAVIRNGIQIDARPH
jgi:HEAT repeat protein